MAYRMGAAIAYAHHFSKGNKSGTDQIDRASGAGAWARDPDAILTLSPHELEDCYVLEATVRNYPTPEDSVWRQQFPTFIPEEDADPSKLRKKHGGANRRGGPETVRDYLGDNGPKSRADLAKKLAEHRTVSERTTRNWIKKAEEDGIVIQDGKRMVLPENQTTPEDCF